MYWRALGESDCALVVVGAQVELPGREWPDQDTSTLRVNRHSLADVVVCELAPRAQHLPHQHDRLPATHPEVFRLCGCLAGSSDPEPSESGAHSECRPVGADALEFASHRNVVVARVEVTGRH